MLKDFVLGVYLQPSLRLLGIKAFSSHWPPGRLRDGDRYISLMAEPKDPIERGRGANAGKTPTMQQLLTYRMFTTL